MEKLKLNYHVTEECNFRCKFCFAKYAGKTLGFEGQKAVIQKIARSNLFDEINFAGGEPLLDKNIVALIKYAFGLGLKVSIITNGFLLDIPLLSTLLPYLSMLGISVHSFDRATKRGIGACTRSGQFLENERLAELCGFVRSHKARNQRECRIKINTVICSQNKLEDFTANIDRLQVDRWKCLRCQEFGHNQPSLVTDAEYRQFVSRNRMGRTGQVFENDMKDTYIMVNPEGKLLREGADNRSYVEIGSVLEHEISDLLKALPLKESLYHRRYSMNPGIL